MFKPRIKREYWVAVRAESDKDAMRQAYEAVKALGFKPPRTGRVLHPYYDAIFSLGDRASKKPPNALAPYNVFGFDEYKHIEPDTQMSDSPNRMVRVSPVY